MKIYTNKQLKELAKKIRDNERRRIFQYIHNNDEWFSSDFIGETKMFLNMVIDNEEKRDGRTIKEWREHWRDKYGTG